MKKLLTAFLAILILMTSCTNNMESNMNTKHFSTAYSAEELDKFFGGKNANEAVFNSNTFNLHYESVNQTFPIEVTRNPGYSIFKVSQGGYYFVFWSKPETTNENLKENNPFVYFTAYVASKRDKKQFDNLVPGESTAEDVKKIDNYFELSFLMSSKIASYSLLDENTVLEIEYDQKAFYGDYKDLVIKQINTIKRCNSQSKYGAILPYDISFLQ